ncbi:capsule biosynthesis protein [Acidimangrovimonas sediminis]|uniref:capsule biosynthesis protein n=1 Tax=Acidimangrovimonas sediminis TaxID=2056283 RepID=UPI000C80EB0E|nr:capsule biosynthesis protein [Acidimangrovimonas sediminis]
MTTKPKAKKFRVRRDSPLAGMGASDRRVRLQPGDEEEVDDGFGDMKFGDAAKAERAAERGAARGAQRRELQAGDVSGDIAGPREVAAETELDAIRREGLTGRQLRMARRMAQKNGIAATSDFDAVRQLRAQGLDPFQRANMLELVVADSQAEADGALPSSGRGGLPARTDEGPGKLPKTIDPAKVPSTEVHTPEERPEVARARDIMKIQRDIARRRRRRFILMMARLAFFVALPTFLAGFYFYRVATPLYATKSEFVIQKAEPGAASTSMGSLFAGTQFATSQDSISVQSYLQSRDAMMRLDKDIGFKSAFEGDKIDPILRLPDHASNEAAYRLYQRMVKIGYDPTEGSIKMEVIAPTAKESAEFSRALISYAEQQVDQMTQRLREDQMTGARDSYDDAEKKLSTAQAKVVDLQKKFKVLSSDVEVTLVTAQIQALDQQLTQNKLNLQEMLANPNPTQARVDPLKRRIANIEDQIKTLRARMTENTSSGTSLATVQSDLLGAQADVQTRQLMLSQALQSLETARIEANRQVRYLSLSVSPVAPDKPSYPRAFENTLVAFLIFAGLYLMVSMTVSILREQVSA